MRTQLFAGIGLATAITAGASADFTAAMTNGYNVSVTDFFGNSIDLYVMDMYLMSDDANDVLLNVYNMNMSGPGTFYQAVASPTWTPSYAADSGPFDTDAAARGDSFVTIGTIDADISAPAGQKPQTLRCARARPALHLQFLPPFNSRPDFILNMGLRTALPVR